MCKYIAIVCNLTITILTWIIYLVIKLALLVILKLDSLYTYNFLFILQGKKLVFVTNNSTKSRKQYAHKFQSLGIPVTEVCYVKLPDFIYCTWMQFSNAQCLQEEIFSSSFAAAMYLKINEFPPEKKVNIYKFFSYHFNNILFDPCFWSFYSNML